jgi:hypothetical protein
MATQARSSSGTSHGFKHDAFISYTTVDRVWATRLHSDLTQRGFNIAADFTVTEPGRSWKEVLDDALDTSRTLLVLWGPRAAEVQGMHLELAAYLALMRRDQVQDRGLRRILPVFLNKDLIVGAPPELASRQGVIVGANATSWDSPGWADAIDRIAEALVHQPLDVSSPPIAPTPPEILLRNVATLMTSEGNERCWQLTEDLVVAAVDQSALADHELAVRTATGTSLGTRKPWKGLGDVRLDGLLAFQLEPPLAMLDPPPTASPSPGQIIDLWEPQFANPAGRAVIEKASLGGAFGIRVLEGSGRTGAIGWDPSSQRAVVIVFQANKGLHGFPLEEIPRLAGSSQREGASSPPVCPRSR